MANSRIRDASRIRVNSLGPDATEAVGGGVTAGATGAWVGVKSGAFAAGAGGSLGVASEAKVRVQTPGSVPPGGLTGATSTRGAGAFEGSSSIRIRRVMPGPPAGGLLWKVCASGSGDGENGSRLASAGLAVCGVNSKSRLLAEGFRSSRYAGSAGVDCCSSDSIRVKETSLPRDNSPAPRSIDAGEGGLVSAPSKVPNNCVNSPGLFSSGPLRQPAHHPGPEPGPEGRQSRGLPLALLAAIL